MSLEKLSRTFPSREEGLKASTILNNGVAMPWFGLGVWQMEANETLECVQTALRLGYRSIDTARLYRNEEAVGRAVRDSGIPRDQLFVTTKVWNDDMRADRVEAAFDESLQRLGLEYVDLVLLHWPIKGKLVSSWKALERCQRAGKARAIGVSNFMIPHLDELLAQADVVPAVNQIELHPYLQSRPLLNHCEAKGIRMEAWSPLMQAGPIMKDPVLARIAKTHGKSVAQIILRWDVQSGVVTIPKSVREARMIENSDIFGFALSDAEMREIDALERNHRSGADPFNFNF